MTTKINYKKEIPIVILKKSQNKRATKLESKKSDNYDFDEPEKIRIPLEN